MTSQDRRALLLGSLVVAGALVLRALTAGSSAEFARPPSLEQKSRLVFEARATVASLGQLEDSAKVLRAALVGLASSLLAGPTEADALADLSGLVSMLVGRARGRFETAAPEPDSIRIGQLQRVSLIIGFEADTGGLAAFLRSLAESRTVVTAEWIQVAATDPFADQQGPDRLRIDLRVSGWFARASQ